jgi:hypothetical protein
MIQIAQFVLVKWINNNNLCKIAKPAKNIFTNNVYNDGNLSIRHVPYVEVHCQEQEH